MCPLLSLWHTALHTTYAVYLNDKSTPVLFKMIINISIVHLLSSKRTLESRAEENMYMLHLLNMIYYPLILLDYGTSLERGICMEQ